MRTVSLILALVVIALALTACGPSQFTPAPTPIGTIAPRGAADDSTNPTPTPRPTIRPTNTPPPEPTPAPTATASVPHTPTPTPDATAWAERARTLLPVFIGMPPDDIPAYDRSEWRHWNDEYGDCQSARQEVLIEESLVEVSYETEEKCRVVSGEWWGRIPM